MEKIKLIFPLLLGLLFVQCDTAERRQSKAEELIQKHLFETLDNYNSHELISIKLDTLHTAWLANSNMIKLGNEYLEAQANYEQLNSEISDLEHRIKSSSQVALRHLMSGDGSGFWSEAISMDDVKKNLAEQQEERDAAYQHVQALEERLVTANQKIEKAKEFAGWYVTYKFRYTDSSGEPRIHTEYHVVNPELTEILYSWDEEDYAKTQMIELINEILQVQQQSSDAEGNSVDVQ